VAAALRVQPEGDVEPASDAPDSTAALLPNVVDALSGQLLLTL
jgi:hypothetical protein